MSSSRTFFFSLLCDHPKSMTYTRGKSQLKKGKKKKKIPEKKPRNCTSDFPSPHFFSDDRSCMLSINYSEK